MNSSEQLNILIVDDKQANLTSLRALLEDFNVTIVEATSGNEALTHTLSTDFALVLLDVQMPEMDGYETAELMRGSSKTRNTPIIFVTAINTEEKHIFKGYEAGAVDYLPKPLDPYILRSKVKIFLQLYQQRIDLKKQNEALKQANETMIAQQRSVIEEERLRLLLNMSGATIHEINQPLSALLGSIDLIDKHSTDGKEIRGYVDTVKEAGKRIRGIISNYQDFGPNDAVSKGNTSFVVTITEDLNILSIEDSDENYSHILKTLSNYPHLSLSRAKDVKTGLGMLQEQHFDIVLLDYILPDGNGFDFIRQSKEIGIKVPFAVVTGQGDEVVASQMIQAGALDYLPKNKLTESSLIRTIHNIREKYHLIREIEAKNAELKMMVTEDELTGVFNRRYLNTSLQSEFERAIRYNQEMVLLMLDLDNFKLVNDTYGHPTGDIVLKELGKVLKDITRQSDIVCRYGGEEFTVILPNSDHQNGYHVAEKIRESFSQCTFAHENTSFSMTLSIGGASSHQTDSPEQLLSFADQALYKAKQTGRNRVVLYTPN